MEVLPDGRNFEIAREEKLSEVLEELEKHLPDSIKIHQTLKTYLNDRVWDFHFYVPKSWPEQKVVLHFPGMTLTPNGKLYESFGVFCPRDRLEDLELLFGEDVLVDWSRPIYLNFTHADIMAKISEFYGRVGTMESLLGDFYILAEKPEEEKEEEEEEEEEVFVEDAALQQLSKDHAQTIHELYPANNMESIEVFEALIQRLPCYGVFAADGDLAAWMVQSYYGAMFSMQTRPQYRRKGYGIQLAKKLTRQVAERGYLPYVVIRPENDASKSLYTKLGFKKHFQTVRAILRPNGDVGENTGGGGE